MCELALTLTLLTWTIWRMGFNSAFKGLMKQAVNTQTMCLYIDNAIIAEPLQHVAGCTPFLEWQTNGHNRYCALLRGVTHVKIAIRGALPHKLVCNFYCRYVTYKCGHGLPVRSQRVAVSTPMLCIVIVSNGRLKVKKEYGRPWKEAVVGWSEVLLWNLSEVAEENHEVFQSVKPT